MMMPRHPLLRVLLVVALVELVVGTASWHGPLVETVQEARQFWSRADVQRAPFDAWRGVFDQAGRALKKPDTVLGALLAVVLGAVFVLVGVPLMMAGAIVIAVLWLLPYLVVQLALWIVWLLVTLRLLPLGPVAIWLYRRQRMLAAGGGMPCATRGPAPAPPIARVVPGPAPIQATLAVMGPEQGALAGRIDAYTRTAFLPGERFVKCGGRCGRAYKLATWVQLSEQCPVDGVALALGQARPATTVTATEPHHSSPA